jgi:hypothetical protein
MDDQKTIIRFIQDLTHAARVMIEWGDQKLADHQPLSPEERDALRDVDKAMPEIKRLTAILRKPDSRP